MTQPPTSMKTRMTWAGSPDSGNTEHEVSFSGITGKQLEQLQYLERYCAPTIRMSLHDGELIAYEHEDLRMTEHYIQPDGTMESYIFDQDKRDWIELKDVEAELNWGHYE